MALRDRCRSPRPRPYVFVRRPRANQRGGPGTCWVRTPSHNRWSNMASGTSSTWTPVSFPRRGLPSPRPPVPVPSHPRPLSLFTPVVDLVPVLIPPSTTPSFLRPVLNLSPPRLSSLPHPVFTRVLCRPLPRPYPNPSPSPTQPAPTYHRPHSTPSSVKRTQGQRLRQVHVPDDSPQRSDTVSPV